MKDSKVCWRISSFLGLFLCLFISVGNVSAAEKKFQWSTRLTVSEQYDDNVNLDKDNKDDDRYNRNQEKQIDRLKRRAGKIDKFLKENEPKINHQGQEIKSNITDNDSEKMVTSHGTIQGYNGQALVDDKFQIIVHAAAMGKGQDREHVLPMIDGAKENMKAIGLKEDYFRGKEFTADSNYHSTVNLKKCSDEELDAYIPDVNFRKRDPRFNDQNRYKPVKKKHKHFKLEDFTYDIEKN